MRPFHVVPLLAGCALIAASCSDNNVTEPNIQATSLVHLLPDHNTLRAKLREVLEEQNGGLGFEMWGTILDRNGKVVDVVFSGESRGDQWSWQPSDLGPEGQYR
jgi:hypothetical protein